MRNSVTALALSIMLCSGPVLTPEVLAAGAKTNPNVPTLKSAITQNSTHVELTLGKAQVVHLNMPAKRVSISDPEVVGIVLLSPTEVELIGKSIGVANLLVWGEETGQNYLTIDLSVHRDVSTLANKIQMIDPGINILPVAAEDSVILTGVAESMEKAQLAFDLAKAFFEGDSNAGGGNKEVNSNSPGSASLASGSTKIINLIRVMGQPSTKAEMVQERLKDIDPNIVLKVVPGFGGKEKAVLTGRVKNASMVSKAVNVASVFYGTPGIKIVTGQGGNTFKDDDDSNSQASFSVTARAGGLVGNMAHNILNGSIITDTSGNVVSMLEVEERPQIKCSIKFLEVQKVKGVDLNSSSRMFTRHLNYSTYAGRHGRATIEDQTVLLNDIDTFYSQVNGNEIAEMGIRYGQEFASYLSGLVTDGKARVLAEPNITSISGEPASFLAGGEFPIPLVSQNNGVSVLFKEFGIRLNLLATVTDRGTVHMQVTPEVSTLDDAAGINISGFLIPGLKTRRSQSVVEMKSGENFIMSGLYNQDMTNTMSKTPILGQIPILGNLFRSTAFQRQETELLIVIHPEIIDSMNLSNVEQSNKTRQAMANVKQVATLSPADMADQYRDKLDKLENIKQQPSSIEQAAAKAEETNPLLKDPFKPLEDQSKTSKEVMQDFKKANKEIKKTARKVSAKAKAEKKAADKAEAKPQAQAAAATVKAPETAVKPAIAPTLDPAFLKQHKEELLRLIGQLEAPREPVVAETPEPVVREAQKAPAEKETIQPVALTPKDTQNSSSQPTKDATVAGAAAPVTAAKVAKPEAAVKAPATSKKPAASPKAAPAKTSPKPAAQSVPEAAQPQAAKPVPFNVIAKKPVMKKQPAQASPQRFIQNQMKMMQNGFSRFFNM